MFLSFIFWVSCFEFSYKMSATFDLIPPLYFITLFLVVQFRRDLCAAAGSGDPLRRGEMQNERKQLLV